MKSMMVFKAISNWFSAARIMDIYITSRGIGNRLSGDIAFLHPFNQLLAQNNFPFASRNWNSTAAKVFSPSWGDLPVMYKVSM